MHIVALNHVYWPNSAATAQLLTELAEGLAARGHEVTVIARADSPRDPADGLRNGVRIVRVRDSGLGKTKLWRRAADYASFYAGALKALVALDRKPDVFMALTTPPLIALAAQGAALFRKTPVVSVVQDLYPDVAVALGAIPRGSLFHRAFAEATRLSFSRSAAIVTLSDAMRRRVLAYGAAPERVTTIANWALSELEATPPTPEVGAEARIRYGLGDRFVVMYSGNIGAGHQFDTFIAAAKELRDDTNIVFCVVGDGVRRPEIEEAVRRDGLENVRLMPLAPREFLAESLGAADVHVVTLRDDMAGLIVPSKLYGIFAAAKACLFIGPAEADVADAVKRADAGGAFVHGDVAGVVGWLRQVASMPDGGKALGANGRRYLEAECSRHGAILAYERVLAEAAGQPIPNTNAADTGLAGRSAS